MDQVVVATNIGASVRYAVSVFSSGHHVYTVGNPASAHERGLVLHEGISRQTRDALEENGVIVVLADRSMFQSPSLSLTRASWSVIQSGMAPEGRINALSVADSVLR